MMSNVHTLVPNAAIPYGFFDEDNIRFIQHKIVEVLHREFKQSILIDRGSIVRLMERVVEERREVIPKMNMRTIMYACNDFRDHQAQANRNLNWEGHYVVSQRLYDPTVERASFDPELNTPPNRLGKPKIGGTTRFYFT